MRCSDYKQGSGKVECCLDCSDHEMVGLSIVREGSMAKSKITAQELRRTDFGFFRYQLDSIPLDKAMKGRKVQERWLIFKDHLLQESSPSQRAGKQGKIFHKACTDKQGTPGNTWTKSKYTGGGNRDG